jgi:hypothetical protein
LGEEEEVVCHDAISATKRFVAVARTVRPFFFWHDCDLEGSWVSLEVKVLDPSLALRVRGLEGQDLQP